MKESLNYLPIFKSVLKQEAEALFKAMERVDEPVVDSLIQLFEKLKLEGGCLVFCGVGKSGLIAQKIAATFTSIGLNSWFLHPTEALHGDIGRVQSKDAIVFISKSGSTEEIIKLFPFLTNPKSNLIALCGKKDSEIVKRCGIFIDCTIEKEACTNNLAPTTSSTVTLAMGDAMAVIYESWIGLSKEGFAKNHPGGLLGKSLLLKVSSLMVGINQCAVATAKTKMKDVLLVMTKYPTGICCIVDDHKKLLGIIVEGDIRRHLTTTENLLEVTVDLVMNKNPKKIHPEVLAYDALTLMEKDNKQVYVLPVVNEHDILFGVLRLHDLMKEGLTK